ncbi:MAG: hypothetical protein MJZ02_03955 [Paludibacteraceae bacterium]|nr:hypothetical protein [Paludibacteraceae bacterium]
MEQYFYILYIAAFTFFIAFAFFLLKHLNQEYELYRLFTKNTDMRALLARDPKRFHISLVYLMTYMTRSDGNAIQYDKLELIVKYIREVCPKEYQKDAIEVLSYLTFREKGSGKQRETESLIDVDAFNKGSDNCIKRGDDSFHYEYSLHGERLAEELALYMTEDDRLYVMYMLYRLAVADGKITTRGKWSELYMLNRLCVKGLKIGKEQLDDLLKCFTEGKSQIWYDQHFAYKENRYPSSDVIANLFRNDVKSFAFLDKQISVTSVLGSVQVAFLCSIVVYVALLFLFFTYEDDLMGEVYPVWIFIVGVVAAFLVPLVGSVAITELESSLVPIVRTKIENSLQLRGLIVSSILSVIVIVTFFWGISNVLFLVANETFSSEKPLVVTVPVTDTYTTTSSRNHITTCYVRFPRVSLADKQFDVEYRKKVSPQNSFCLKTLPIMSGMTLKGVKNTRTMESLEVGSSTYDSASGRNMRLHFKVGYFGLVFFDKYELE